MVDVNFITPRIIRQNYSCFRRRIFVSHFTSTAGEHGEQWGTVVPREKLSIHAGLRVIGELGNMFAQTLYRDFIFLQLQKNKLLYIAYCFVFPSSPTLETRIPMRLFCWNKWGTCSPSKRQVLVRDGAFVVILQRKRHCHALSRNAVYPLIFGHCPTSGIDQTALL